ncbi:hypothetical protein [Pantoea cypripedii]|jgi:hypothetical protein|uniref:Uncharacterized protein n=1 Tax=Pantoea cypripedii TaxID=55209 RepID=A0A6B9GFI6_PANCY|nr:hypothetical protein [Pantoea cypripedii]QGY32145.1 hypothetical protein CUN67_24440 [Pantoea cypripedii]
MYSVLSQLQAQEITGGNDLIYKCWDSRGNEYWSSIPNSEGCLNSQTGQMEYGTSGQPKKGEGSPGNRGK